MMFLFWPEIMSFKIPKMIFTIFLFSCHEQHEQTVIKISIDVFFIPAVPVIGIKRIGNLKLFIGNELCKIGGVVHASSAIDTNINDKIFYFFPPQVLKRIFEKTF